jgi:hypothetical protein
MFNDLLGPRKDNEDDIIFGCDLCQCVQTIDWQNFVMYIGPSRVICPCCNIPMKRK